MKIETRKQEWKLNQEKKDEIQITHISYKRPIVILPIVRHIVRQ